MRKPIKHTTFIQRMKKAGVEKVEIVQHLKSEEPEHLFSLFPLKESYDSKDVNHKEMTTLVFDIQGKELAIVIPFLMIPSNEKNTKYGEMLNYLFALLGESQQEKLLRFYQPDYTNYFLCKQFDEFISLLSNRTMERLVNKYVQVNNLKIYTRTEQLITFSFTNFEERELLLYVFNNGDTRISTLSILDQIPTSPYDLLLVDLEKELATTYPNLDFRAYGDYRHDDFKHFFRNFVLTKYNNKPSIRALSQYNEKLKVEESFFVKI